MNASLREVGVNQNVVTHERGTVVATNSDHVEDFLQVVDKDKTCQLPELFARL